MLDGDNPAGGLMGQGKGEGVGTVASDKYRPPWQSRMHSPSRGRENRARCVWKHGLEAVEGSEGQGARGRAWVASRLRRCCRTDRTDERRTACPSTKHCSSVSVCATRLARLRRQHSNEGRQAMGHPLPPRRCRVSTLTVEAPPPPSRPGSTPAFLPRPVIGQRGVRVALCSKGARQK